MRRVRVLGALALAVAILLPAPHARAEIQSVTCCFQNPEVALWDPGSRAWYVSSYGGYTLDQVDREGNGFISKLTANGELLGGSDWLTGLNSPWDMDVYKGKLYVADIRELVVVDIGKAKIVRKIRIPNTNEFLNGVAVDPSTGDVYLSGWTDDTIYKVTGANSRRPKASIFLRSPKLETPNDMLIERGKMIVTADGPGFFTSSFDPTQGRLLSVDMRTKKIKPISDRFGVPDGIVKVGRDYITDDYLMGRILRVRPNGEIETISQHPSSVAELSFDPKRNVLSVAQSAENAVVFETL